MAIGITPPSLRILSLLGLAEQFIQQGVPIHDCFIHGESGCLGRVTFRDIPDEHRFILSLPQARTISILQRKLAEFSSVTRRPGVEVTHVRQMADGATVTFYPEAGGEPETVNAQFVVGCDGSRSLVREMAGIRQFGGRYHRHFVMGDFADSSGLLDEAHLFFTKDGSVESFPLPRGLRRWIVQTDSALEDVPADFLSMTTLSRTGITPMVRDQINQSSFTPHWFNCDTYHAGRIVLCGDAAHGMSPIGGQGMNTGFADAEFLTEALLVGLHRPTAIPQLLKAYTRYRRRAAGSAIRRAHWGMWLGTWRGKPLSVLRDFIIRHVLCKGPISHRMGPFYAMLTIPYNTLDRVPPIHGQTMRINRQDR
jgi:2-polyprenyl-6-methoxyphenol hydroxylase-like FAD-dependent oxidoreductase